MGYKITLPKDKSFLGIEIPDAYHSIEDVTLTDGYIKITVAVYPSRDAKYTKGTMYLSMQNPVYNETVLLDSGEMAEPQGPDIASYTSISFTPAMKMVVPKLGTYALLIDATALFPDGLPYDLLAQKEALYPTVKRLLGHADATDMFEDSADDLISSDVDSVLL